MITATEEPLERHRTEKLKAWLNADEASLMLEVVSGQIALMQIEAAEMAQKDAVNVVTNRDIPPKAKDRMLAAALLRMFIDQYSVLASQDNFMLTKVNVT